jgi:hypothetical protein
MRQKSKSTKQQKSRAELRTQLARDLASIMANPETPSTLYNEIADCLCDMSSEIDYNAPEMIERCISAHISREEKRKGGTR